MTTPIVTLSPKPEPRPSDASVVKAARSLEGDILDLVNMATLVSHFVSANACVSGESSERCWGNRDLLLFSEELRDALNFGTAEIMVRARRLDEDYHRALDGKDKDDE